MKRYVPKVEVETEDGEKNQLFHCICIVRMSKGLPKYLSLSKVVWSLIFDLNFKSRSKIPVNQFSVFPWPWACDFKSNFLRTKIPMYQAWCLSSKRPWSYYADNCLPLSRVGLPFAFDLKEIGVTNTVYHIDVCQAKGT